MIEYIKHHSRSIIFTASLPPSNAASVRAALQAIKDEPERREQLWKNTEYMRKGFKEMGYDTGESTTPVIPVLIGKDQKTFATWKALMEAGVYTNPVVAPATPPGRGLLRTSYMATHTKDQLDFCLDQFEKVGKKLKVI